MIVMYQNNGQNKAVIRRSFCAIICGLLPVSPEVGVASKYWVGGLIIRCSVTQTRVKTLDNLQAAAIIGEGI